LPTGFKPSYDMYRFLVVGFLLTRASLKRKRN